MLYIHYKNKYDLYITVLFTMPMTRVECPYNTTTKYAFIYPKKAIYSGFHPMTYTKASSSGVSLEAALRCSGGCRAEYRMRQCRELIHGTNKLLSNTLNV